MGLPPRDRLAAAWARLRLAVAGPVDVVVTHCEVNDRHGTGVLLLRLLGEGARVVTVRSRTRYGGEQRFGVRRLKLAHGARSPAAVRERVAATFGGLEVRRILCVPYYPDDARTAVALAEATGAPLATWVMDDQNVHARAIDDELLRVLLERSALRLAIAPELRDAYQAKFGLPMAIVPPVVPAARLLTTPIAPSPERLATRRGLIIGNIWDAAWLDGLVEALAGSGVTLDWHSAGGTPWRRDDEARLAAAGLRIRPFLREDDLVAALRACPFVVVPTGDLAGRDSHGFLAQLSLPSRIPFASGTAGAPTIVLGHPDTAAARFVTRHGLGVVAPYRSEALSAAVAAVSAPEAQARHRAAAAALAPLLSSEGALDWIWRSLALGRPVDQRWEALAR